MADTTNTAYSRMHSIQTPIIPLIKELIHKNPGTIPLDQGVVSYDPPKGAIAAIQDFLEQPQSHKYQSTIGIPSLLSGIQTKLRQDNHIDIGNDNCIVVSAGSNMGFLNAILAITHAGDEIILNTPYYFNHEMAIRMINCEPISVQTDDQYQPRIDALHQAITPKTKAIVTISPNNPTGVVYDAATLKEINQICQDAGIYHISDEAYEYFTYDQVSHTSPASFPNSTPHTISLFSLSKTYGFASWRIGYMVIPKKLLPSILKIQDTNLICPPVISQHAAVGALDADKTYLSRHVSAIEKVRERILQKLKALPESCQIVVPNGAFYFFLKVNSELSDLALVKQLIEKNKVATLPGQSFGMQDGCYLRISYGSLTLENASLGIDRLAKGIQELTT
ncbi:pyridoxal phosphate-dependent aminotransferase [Leptothoe sp. PORK10 BA2]|uniref:pyridoxal phosphate-dependent aminotransferase n=1 Tax=Leptothoe sp. PORK10 BA2 TaxID=3110254 RepID=UPI002B1EDC63|nr:pyridoxal phosphate-dependent aminotransferase [Leptothoe sp. PORK10 BA2]MEA5466044.1 pyridoxal phosphate-dependent aminotransferase [Leptothoe sp. PORK10 BA2]